MFFKPMARMSLNMLLILGVSVLGVAQTPASRRQSLPRRNSEKYWLAVNESADRAIRFAYAKHFVQVHESSLTDRQCQQYLRIALDYGDQLAAVKRLEGLLKMNSGTICGSTR